MSIKKEKKRKRKSIPQSTQLILWGMSGGRCAICNKVVYADSLTQEKLNLAQLAHIIASSDDGPRGEPGLSEDLETDISNIMLLCGEHHKKIDTTKYVQKYPNELLRKIKAEHEDRVKRVTGINRDQKSHVLLYGANIGQQNHPVNYNDAASSMFLKERFPSGDSPTQIGLVGSAFKDNEENFWEIERINVERIFNEELKPKIGRGEISHLSVFGLAPIPLLVYLGHLLTDKTKTDVYQLHREPSSWDWNPFPEVDESYYSLTKEVVKGANHIALVFSLSGEIGKGDIKASFGQETNIWTFSIDVPHNNFMQSESQLSAFRSKIRRVFNDIKAEYGTDTEINIFPAIPNSTAIEIGRVWMPKADLPLIIWDRNRENLEFKPAIRIG